MTIVFSRRKFLSYDKRYLNKNKFYFILFLIFVIYRNEQIYPSRSHFCLVKTVSLLDIIDEDIQKNDMRQFWKLNPLSEASDNEIPNTQIKFTNIAETERKKVDELTRNSFLVSKNIDSKTNSQTEPVRRISLNQNLTSIINNITLSDTIEAGNSYIIRYYTYSVLL